MKIIKPILPIPLLLLCGVGIKPRYAMIPAFEVGPYTKYQSNPTVPYTIKSTYKSEQTMYEIFRFGTQANPSQRTVTKPTHTMQPGEIYEGAFTLPTSLFLGDYGMSIKLQLFWEDGYLFKEISFVIFPVSSEVIDPTKYQEGYYCRDTHAVVADYDVHISYEKYSFPHVDDYFLTDIYYRLPLDQFVIQTTLKEDEFSYTSAFLNVYNLEPFFPGLVFKNGVASLPLLVSYNEGLLTLSLKNYLYVDPYDLTIYNTHKMGKRLSKTFYLPINHAKDLLGSTFSIVINEVGYNKLTFEWEVTLLSEAPLIGDCQNSGYCVVGNVKR